MIRVIVGNIFDTGAAAIVDPVNCDGAMGRGLAKEFRARFPRMYPSYARLCHEGKLRPGTLQYHRSNLLTIINFPTKDHWMADSDMEYIRKGLDCFIATYESFKIKSVAFPALGCGEGKLKWSEVCILMHEKLKSLPIDVEIWVTTDTRQNIYRTRNGTEGVEYVPYTWKKQA